MPRSSPHYIRGRGNKAAPTMNPRPPWGLWLFLALSFFPAAEQIAADGS